VTTPSTDSTSPGSGGRDSTLAKSSAPSHAELYEQAVGAFGAAVVRLARAYERDDDRRQDLLQEIHLALWRSLAGYDGRCSLRTWVYRVAHNVAASHVLRDRRRGARALVSLDALEARTYAVDGQRVADRRLQQGWLHEMVGQLRPVDRQLMLLYLEGMDAAAIGEVSGLSPENVATKIHRIKRILTDRALHGATHVD
jgi:RNA polymerase sigma-70 factor (ECF subfamily)